MKTCENCAFFVEEKTGGWCENIKSSHFIRDVSKNDACTEYFSTATISIMICCVILLVVILFTYLIIN